MNKLKPGYYWARWKVGEDCEWEVVQIARAKPKTIDKFIVLDTDYGAERPYNTGEWLFGPRLELPG